MQDIIKIAKKINDAGGNLYLVGGAVRDEFLGRKINDKDYVVEGLTNKKLKELFPNAISRGKQFSVWEIEGSEFALTRVEKKKEKGHKGFEINTDKVSIIEDLKRRDLTINAIAKEVLTGKIIDPFDGIKDIKQNILRAVSDAFLEDPLRVYRTARFSAMLEWKIEENTMAKMKELKEELKTLSKERVFEEFKNTAYLYFVDVHNCFPGVG